MMNSIPTLHGNSHKKQKENELILKPDIWELCFDHLIADIHEFIIDEVKKAIDKFPEIKCIDRPLLHVNDKIYFIDNEVKFKSIRGDLINPQPFGRNNKYPFGRDTNFGPISFGRNNKYPFGRNNKYPFGRDTNYGPISFGRDTDFDPIPFGTTSADFLQFSALYLVKSIYSTEKIFERLNQSLHNYGLNVIHNMEESKNIMAYIIIN